MSALYSLIMLVLVIAFFAFFAETTQALIDAERAPEQKCHDYLASHGYTFVDYHPATFGSPDECWGSINGTSIRAY